MPIAKDILNLLTDLLVRDLSQVGLKTNRTTILITDVATEFFDKVNPYVNGALYSLLGNKDINMEAKTMGVEAQIVSKCQVCRFT